MHRVLIVGGGAREHAIARALAAGGGSSAKNVQLLHAAPKANPGIVAEGADFLELPDASNPKAIAQLAKKAGATLAVLGPEAPIVAGAADALWEAGIPTIGPKQSSARLEGSKGFTRELLRKNKLAGNPRFAVFAADLPAEQREEGFVRVAAECADTGFVVKADGLMGGKGVLVMGDHFQTAEEGFAHARTCLSGGQQVVLEEKLEGEEFSLMFFVSGDVLVPMPPARDYKRAFEGDAGPNTGGMGAYSCADFLLPFLGQKDIDEAAQIAQDSLRALKNETGEDFIGIAFGGFMKTATGVRLIEWNVRFGDPESLCILPLLATPLLEIFLAMTQKRLDEIEIHFKKRASCTKYLVPRGYPEAPKTGQVQLDPSQLPGVQVFFGNVFGTHSPSQFALGGSRAVAIAAQADTPDQASARAETACQQVIAASPDVWHRSDIGRIEGSQS